MKILKNISIEISISSLAPPHKKMTTQQPDLLKENAFNDAIQALHPMKAKKFDADTAPPADLLAAILGYLLRLIQDESPDKTRAAEAIQILKSLVVFTIKVQWVLSEIERNSYTATAQIVLDTHCNDSKGTPLVFLVRSDTVLGIAALKFLEVDFTKTSVKHKF